MIDDLPREGHGLRCFHHDIELIKVFIEDDGTINADIEWMEYANGMICPVEDCMVIICQDRDFDPT